MPAQRDASLVIVGAGLSGLNALVCARKYLSPDETIMMVDERHAYGGHWVDAYDFVHLHQPYEYYTAYDEEWTQQYPRTHLATKQQILDHFTTIAARNNATPLFGHRYVERTYNRDEKDAQLLVKLQHGKEEVYVKTKRLIIANPITHNIKKRFQLSSKAVTSISITELSKHMNNSKSDNSVHYVIIGGGKSAMDAVLHAHERQKENKNTGLMDPQVTLVAGNGVAFLKRQNIFPDGLFASSFGGTSAITLITQVGLQWDGENEIEVLRRLVKRKVLHSPVDDPRSCQFGILGIDELAKIKQAVSQTIIGRLRDVQDIDDIPTLIMEDDRRIPIANSNNSEIVVVNCTEMYAPTDELQPILEDSGRTLNVQLLLFSPIASALILTHAWFLDKLEGKNGLLALCLPLELSTDPVDKEAGFFRSSLVTIHNVGAVLKIIPSSVSQCDKTNAGLWFPIFRQLYSLWMLFTNLPEVRRRCVELFGNPRFPLEKKAVTEG